MAIFWTGMLLLCEKRQTPASVGQGNLQYLGGHDFEHDNNNFL